MADTQVAETILSQLGGRMFTRLTGAKNLVAGLDFLMFRIAGREGINKVKIVLGGDDLYRMEFWKIRAAKMTLVCSYEDVFCDELQDRFEAATGLYVTLMPRRG